MTNPFFIATKPLPRAFNPRQSHPPLCQTRAPRIFVRLHITPTGALHLQTASTTYTSTVDSPPQAPHQLHIHSLLHIADANYYRTLQTSLLNLSKSPQTALLFELITNDASLTPAPLRRLKTPVQPAPSAKSAALLLRAVPQAAALDLSLPNAYIADLSQHDVRALSPRFPRPSMPSLASAFLRALALLLPFPELQLLLSDSRQFSPLVADALLRFDVARARRHAYAARAVSTTQRRSFQTLDRVTVERNRAATRAVKHVVASGASQVAIMYGAWHSPYFCRWAEDVLRMSCTRVNWRTAMVLQADGWTSGLVGRLYAAWNATTAVDVSDLYVKARLLPPGCVLVWVLLAATYAAYAAVDWITSFETVIKLLEHAMDSSQFANAAAVSSLYIIRHVAPYVALRKWFEVSRDVE